MMVNRSNLIKYSILGSLIGIVAVIAALKINRANPITPPPTPSPISSRFGALKPGLVISYTDIRTPSRANLKKYSAAATPIEEYAEQLAVSLNLVKNEGTNLAWKSEDNKTWITVNQQPLFVQIQFSPTRTEKTGTNLNVATQALESMLRQHNLPFVAMPERAIFLNNTREYDASIPSKISPQAAVAVRIPLVHLLDNIPLYIDDSPTTMSHALLNTDNQIIQIIVYPPPKQLSSLKNSKILTAAQAINNIELGFATVVSFNNGSDILPPLSSITAIDIVQADYEYRMNTETGNIDPYYHFYGSTDQQQIEIITPMTE